MRTASALVDSLIGLVGANGVLKDAAVKAPYLKEWRGRWPGQADVVVLPESTQQVSEVLRFCYERDVPIVPQGGNTGLCGGASPNPSAVLLNTERLNSIRALDVENRSMVVEAGCRLADVQRAAKQKDCLFPVSLVPEEQACIGGILATNAGGTNVLHYGNAREQCMGLEVVLPDGRIWNGLNQLRKNNAGYDLQNIFIGSEGTLGVITAAVLKLQPRRDWVSSVWLSLPSVDAAVNVLDAMRDDFGDSLTACELMSDFSVSLVQKHLGRDIQLPSVQAGSWYLLLDVSEPLSRYSPESQLARGTQVRQTLARCSLSADQVRVLPPDQCWPVRKAIPAAQVAEGASIKQDISLPVSAMSAFIPAAAKAAASVAPGCRPCIFGHLGDGNLHFNVSAPEGMAATEFHDFTKPMNHAIFEQVMSRQGSFAAEHGVGQARVAELERYSDPVGLALMKSLKTAFDPKGLMNPGKVLRRAASESGERT